MIEFRNIALDAIIESTFNPRKNFDPAKLAELSESIKASGVLQPILVRPLTGDRVSETDRTVQFEIIAGARRYRASELAGLATIPAIVRAMSNDAAMEAAILENLQRDDLTELEEAEGYEALMAHASINADAVAAKIGKSRSYVFGRLKLLDLSQDCKQAMRKGKMSAAEAAASIAAAMQDQDDGDDEDADDGVPNIANDTPRMGVKVRISAQHLHPKQQKYAGKEGTITGKLGDAWDVTFRGRSGGISSFMADQISVVVA